MDTIQQIQFGAPLDDFEQMPINPDDYEDHKLINDSIRGKAGEVVKIHKNDLAILRANNLIAPTKAKAEKAATQPKAEKAAQPKAEKAAQPKAEKAAQPEVAELPAIPSIADLPGV